MAPLFSGAEPFVQFGRRRHEEQFCEIILNLDHLFRRRCHLKDFLSRHVRRSGTIYAILVEGNIYMKLF